ncbi:hypothetical protein J1605_017816, partial [Eschrichtius robustus]
MEAQETWSCRIEEGGDRNTEQELAEGEVPYVLKSCAEFIETHGIVDGIYRLSGVTSNIQRL